MHTATTKTNNGAIIGGTPSALRDPKRGFRSFGELALAVRAVAITRIQDPRLKLLNAVPSTAGSEGVGPDGGYAVAPEFADEIRRVVFAPDALISLTDLRFTDQNQFVLPADETTPWDQSHGIVANWTPEGTALTVTKPEIQARNVKLEKLTVFVSCSDELVEDAAGLSAYLPRVASEKLDYKVTDALINGTGAGEPQGILHSTARITAPAVAAQGANTIVYRNCAELWSRSYGPGRRSSVWLINQDVEPFLAQMQAVIGSATTSPPPVYDPAAGTLFGRPLITSEACAALGTEGDIIVADMRSMFCAVRRVSGDDAEAGIRSAASIHLFFDAPATAFRFVMRVGAQSWKLNAITRRVSSTTVSPFVTLSSTRT
jgi:HK97 family phage major capsid protein